MIATPELQTHLRANGTALTHLEECCRQMAGERELRAFLAVTRTLYGEDTAANAADDWIELACSVQRPLPDGPLNWRRVTLLVSSRLAISHLGLKQQVDEAAERNDGE